MGIAWSEVLTFIKDVDDFLTVIHQFESLIELN